MSVKLNKTPMALVPATGLRANLETNDTFVAGLDYELMYTTDGKQLFVMGTAQVHPVQTLDMAVTNNDEIISNNGEIVYNF